MRTEAALLQWNWSNGLKQYFVKIFENHPFWTTNIAPPGTRYVLFNHRILYTYTVLYLYYIIDCCLSPYRSMELIGIKLSLWIWVSSLVSSTLLEFLCKYYTLSVLYSVCLSVCLWHASEISKLLWSVQKKRCHLLTRWSLKTFHRQESFQWGIWHNSFGVYISPSVRIKNRIRR